MRWWASLFLSKGRSSPPLAHGNFTQNTLKNLYLWCLRGSVRLFTKVTCIYCAIISVKMSLVLMSPKKKYIAQWDTMFTTQGDTLFFQRVSGLGVFWALFLTFRLCTIFCWHSLWNNFYNIKNQNDDSRSTLLIVLPMAPLAWFSFRNFCCAEIFWKLPRPHPLET